MSTIGIKIADGNYYPIIDTTAVGKKRLVLTTVNDNQENVQVDLYMGEDDSIESATYIGSLVLEKLIPAGKGEPELELIIGIDEENNLTASIGDERSGDKQSMSLGLDSLSEGNEFDLPEFDLDTSVEPSSEITAFEDEDFDIDIDESDFDEKEIGGEFEEELPFEEEPPPVAEQRRASPGLLIIFVILGLIIIGLLAFLIYRSFQGEETPGLFARLAENRTEEVRGPDPGDGENETQPAAGADGTENEPEAAAETEDAGEASAEESGMQSGGEKPVVLNEDKMGGVWYWIRWGDTLWEISYSFYRTPWLYGKIAGANEIRNPDLIYANTRLFIPEL